MFGCFSIAGHVSVVEGSAGVQLKRRRTCLCHTFQLKGFIHPTTPTSQCRQQSGTGVHSLSTAGLQQDTPVNHNDSLQCHVLLGPSFHMGATSHGKPRRPWLQSDPKTPTVDPLCPVLYSCLHRFTDCAHNLAEWVSVCSLSMLSSTLQLYVMFGCFIFITVCWTNCQILKIRG